MAKLIYNDKVYTSFFAAVDKYVMPNRQVSIAIWASSTFKGSTYEALAPSRELKDAYQAEEITAKQFEEIYYETVLSKLDPLTVYNDLKGKVLCCWETRRQFCHRHLVIKWLKEKLGDDVIGGEL